MSHNQGMENKQQTQKELTKAATIGRYNGNGVVISAGEAAEYCEYKKQRKRAEIRSAMLKSEGVLVDNSEAKKICDRALKYRQAAVRVTPTALAYVRPWLAASGVRVDCVIGGDGETLTKVKSYEAKCALKLRAKELTAVLSTSMLAERRYGEIRKEIKRLRRVAIKAVLKVRLARNYLAETLTEVCKICSGVGVDYLSVPLFDGCERIRASLSGHCRLEVYGVETLDEYQKMVNAGVERIVTERVEEIQLQWLREVEKINVSNLTVRAKNEEKSESANEEKTEEKANVKTEEKAEEKSETKTDDASADKTEENAVRRQAPTKEETDYQCRLEGAELKFL